MYLDKMTIFNYRKFKNKDNTVYFANSGGIQDYKDKGNKSNSFDIANFTTLIIGKNNAGKTSIVNALHALSNETKFKSNDFNYEVLNNFYSEMLNIYNPGQPDKFRANFLKNRHKIPYIGFELYFKKRENSNFIISNVAPLISLKEEDIGLKLYIRWEVKNHIKFGEEIYNIIEEIETLKTKYDEDFEKCELEHFKKIVIFEKFIEIFNSVNFGYNYYKGYYKNGNHVKGHKIKDFSISNLLEFHKIEANKVRTEIGLSEAFSDLITARYKSDKFIQDTLNEHILKLDLSITQNTLQLTNKANAGIKGIKDSDLLEVFLRSNLSIEKIFKQIVKYEYLEGENFIPESQYGLGYTNLMMVVAEIIRYLESKPLTDVDAKINLIAIEEPEAFMHPQLQEAFIENINNMILALYDDDDAPNINSQLIITTHSPSIVNSKLQENSNMDIINYVNIKNKDVFIAPISASKLNTGSKSDLKFLKKHLSYYSAELFYADAVIFVEGMTEESIIKQLLKDDNDFKDYKVSIFVVGGAHVKVYTELIKALRIPTLVICDLDYKEKNKKLIDADKPQLTVGIVEEIRKSKSTQQDSNDILTTNHSLIEFLNLENKSLLSILDVEYDKNYEFGYITTQSDSIENIYPSSFEEAIILSNPESKIVKKALEKSVSKQIFEKHSNNLIGSSGILQKRIDKNSFAISLQYELMMNESNDFRTPKYIRDGLNYLISQLSQREGVDLNE